MIYSGNLQAATFYAINDHAGIRSQITGIKFRRVIADYYPSSHRTGTRARFSFTYREIINVFSLGSEKIWVSFPHFVSFFVGNLWARLQIPETFKSVDP